MAEKKPGRKPRVSDDELLDVFRSADDPVLTSGDVAENAGRATKSETRWMTHGDALAFDE